MLGLIAVLLGLAALALTVRKTGVLMRGGLLPRGHTVPVRVLGRTSLGPKQGLAVVAIGERTLVVSVGDGGVRALGELDEVKVESNDPAPQSGIGDERPVGTPGWGRLAPMRSRASNENSSGRVPRHPRLRLLTVLFGLLGGSTPPEALAAQPAAVMFAPALAAASLTELPLDLPALDVAGLTSGSMPQEQAGGGRATEPGSRITPEELSQLAERLGVTQADQESTLRIDGPIGMVLFMGLMAVLPTLVLLMTSFTRILVVLHFLRQALGTQTAPPGHLLAALALLLTTFVMGPTFDAVHSDALRPWMDGEIEQAEMLTRAQGPFRSFMLGQTRESDLVRFVEIADPVVTPQSAEEVSLPILLSAFVTSELRAAFQVGFALFLPFVVIDVVVASVLMSMGMFMLPPVMVSLPIKLLLFVLVDGWGLLVEGLVTSF